MINQGQVEIPNCLPLDEEDSFAQNRTGVTVYKDASYITMELMKHGDFFSFIQKRNGLKHLELTRYLFKQICEGVKHIHNAGFCHLDLKIDNILIGNDFNLKISDFGMAMPREVSLYQVKGTKTHIAPEIFEVERSHRHYKGIQADIYSLGVILFIIYFGNIPFNCAD